VGPVTLNIPVGGNFSAAMSNRRRWVIVVLLFVASFINYLDRATISVALPLLSTDLGLDPATKGLLLSAFFWSYALMQVPMGWCVDRFNLRWLYAGAFVFWCLACGLTGFAATLGVILILRAALGVGEAIYQPGGLRIVRSLYSPVERGLPTGLFDGGTRFGLALGTPLIAWLIVHYGWRHMFMILGFSALLWLIPWLIAFPNKLPNSNLPSPTRTATSVNRRRFSVTYNRNLLGLCLGLFCFDYSLYLLVTWLPDYWMTVRHVPVMRAGVYTAVPFFIFAVAEPLGGWIADLLIRRGWNETRTRKGIVALACLTGLLLIPATLVSSTTLAVAFVTGASLAGLAPPNILVILQGCAPEEEVGLWAGFQNFTGNLGGVVAPVATGILIRLTGSYLPGFALAAGVLLGGIFAYGFIIGEIKPPHSGK
jgi:MFS transporter, ACS family, D-galactonate transporter